MKTFLALMLLVSMVGCATVPPGAIDVGACMTGVGAAVLTCGNEAWKAVPACQPKPAPKVAGPNS